MARRLTIRGALVSWWRENLARRGLRGALRTFWAEAVDFARDSTPERRRSRYGDIDYDWDNRVDTTWANVGWRTRMIGALVGPGYQPCDPTLFHETLEMLGEDFRAFTFVDIGSGKGRALLMASEYPFRRIIGVEILPELHAIAEYNLRQYQSERQQCHDIRSLCMDARDFEIPADPLVLFLFNPLPEPALEALVDGVDRSLAEHPRALWIVYHNPLLDHVLRGTPRLTRVAGTLQYAIYRSAEPGAPAATG